MKDKKSSAVLILLDHFFFFFFFLAYVMNGFLGSIFYGD